MNDFVSHIKGGALREVLNWKWGCQFYFLLQPDMGTLAELVLN